jgi:aspartyl-tRNA(Asn)/glutamyl-tRNA(Gln) amidotransferase subunit A
MDDGPLTITAAAELIRAGKLSPVELLDICLRRIDRYEPKVKAWVYIDRDRARAEAERLAAELAAGQNRGPLHGIPIGVKDIIDVFDMPTGCGSKLWANSYARRDATVVERLRQAGAVILGKTVTTPYAYLDPPPTRNPWNLDRTPGGSSSGSAAAVACGMCLGALATQTGGSTIRPASYCGVYSLKPTYKRVTRDGILPLAPNLDHVGVMANCVRDLGIILDVIAESPDECTRMVGAEIPLAVNTVRDLLRDRLQPSYSNALDQLADQLTRKNWSIKPLSRPARFADVWMHHRRVMAVEAADFHGDRLDRVPDDYPPRITELIEDGRRVSGVDYRRATDDISGWASGYTAFFSNPSRTIMTPATTGPAGPPDSTGDPSANSPWSHLGLPTVSLPFALSDEGLPVAVQLVGMAWGEADLIGIAAAMEQCVAFPGFRPPAWAR